MDSRALIVAAAAAFCLLGFLAGQAYATDHIVGANRGWQSPAEAGPDANLNYTTWANSHVFVLGDEITFNYQKGLHTVFEVNYSTYVNCTFSMWYGHDWIYNWTNRGSRTKLILNETRPYYFACGMGDHCKQGMKVAINVTKPKTSLQSTNSSNDTSSSDSLHNYPTLSYFTSFLLTQVIMVVMLSVFPPSL